MPDMPEALCSTPSPWGLQVCKLIGMASAVVSQANAGISLCSHPANESHVGPHGSPVWWPVVHGPVQAFRSAAIPLIKITLAHTAVLCGSPLRI